MKKLILVLITTCLLNHAFAQEKDLAKIADSISAEGKALYKSEFASWYGSDIFSDKCKARGAIASGYLSYDSGKGLVNIFFTKAPNPKVLSTITFGYELDPKNYKLDTTDREFTPSEKELYTIRQTAVAEMAKDTIFKYFKHSSLNPIPMIGKNYKRVYILTGPDISGVVVFGNDYMIDFDKDNHILTTRKLHKGLIATQYSSSRDSSKMELAAMHSHLSEYSPYITATDICTLMLYEKFTTWNQNMVISKDYVSIWDCKNNKLVILTAEAWKKINAVENALENKSH
jgi:hypothetical protein